MSWIKRTPDGGIWLKRAPGTFGEMKGVLVRGSVTFHPGDIDYPFWDNYMKRIEKKRAAAREAASEEP